METIKTIHLNKNRGWRGLAEAEIRKFSKGDGSCTTEHKLIFSFSPDVWDDLLKGVIVFQTEENYIVYTFDNIDKLPKPTQQRSVLIKNFTAYITGETILPKETISAAFGTEDYRYIRHFLTNRNNHTTSDWNNVGIRVIPSI